MPILISTDKFSIRVSSNIIGYDFKNMLNVKNNKKYEWWEPINRSTWLYKYYPIAPHETKIKSFS